MAGVHNMASVGDSKVPRTAGKILSQSGKIILALLSVLFHLLWASSLLLHQTIRGSSVDDAHKRRTNLTLT